ncbi:nuclease-related domain-containing protein [Ectobacillus antri]|uniref:Nuclease-related domain-containing protein n=1 Tax=Ectobacillus antri TaxID=2486280 RepID=A0ABT6H7F7_9BACI|nr:nuclease-related domain-containing protein [Ectobacillus antri]MDG4657136.1 nuclease-related domain-containing protein [Ectobacillus antri]MDG5754595.1 nuclease-related domain-containing protein [Ectobacillus antri]
MIKKERKPPLKLQKLEALLRRLPASHPKYKEVEVELAKSRAGYKGELSLDYHINCFASPQHLIFHDLRLPYKQYFFQMDTLLVTPSYLLILEVKNISGTLFLDHQFNQLIRNQNGEEHVFADPILQVRRQAFQLRMWLEVYKIPTVPIEYLVVMTNRNALLKSHKSEPCVIHSEALHEKLQEFDRRYNQPVLCTKKLRKLSSSLIKADTMQQLDVLKQFSIHSSELITGVQCPHCGKFAMRRVYGTWRCPDCEYVCKQAHLSALIDYALLIKPSITNHEFRAFLRLSSINIAKNLLAALQLPYTGETKGRVYELSIGDLPDYVRKSPNSS